MAVPLDPTPAMLAGFRAALRDLGPLTARPRPGGDYDWTVVAAEIEAGAQARHAEKVRRWEASRPMRERAERAMQLAHARRAAELGARSPGRVPVLAALWASEPVRPEVW